MPLLRSAELIGVKESRDACIGSKADTLVVQEALKLYAFLKYIQSNMLKYIVWNFLGTQNKKILARLLTRAA